MEEAIRVKRIMKNERWNDRNARVYDRYKKLFSRKEKKFWRNIILSTDGGKILDIGVGTGFLSEIALELGYNVVGLDLSPSMLNLAIKNLDCEKFIPLLGDAENLPFRDESFDAVMSRYVLWTLPNPRKMLEESIRVLKSDGMLLMSDGKFKRQHLLVKTLNELRSLIMDITIGWRSPTWKRVYKKLNPYLPRWSCTKVVEELRQLGVGEIEVIDLSEHRWFLYRILLGSNWQPFLVVGKKE